MESSWRGNLPCATNHKSGCHNHNPNQTSLFFNSSLPSSYNPSFGSGLIKKVFGKKNNRPSDVNTDAQQGGVEVWSELPTNDTAIYEPLPAVHSSVPYMLAFYHVNAVMKKKASLSALECKGSAGTFPSIQYTFKPLIHNKHLLLQHHFTFTQSLQDAVSGGMVYKYEIKPYLSTGYKFAICPHMTQKFTSCTIHYSNKQLRVKMAYALNNVLKQRFTGVWDSVLDVQPTSYCCGMCFCDFRVQFVLLGEVGGGLRVGVAIWVWRDYGSGIGVDDESWVAAKGGKAVTRNKVDFGRVRRAFEADGSGISFRGSAGD